MPVLPEIQPILDAVNANPPAPEGLSVAELRELSHAGLQQSILAFGEPAPEDVVTRDHQVKLFDAENSTITVRSYTPAGKPPAGGWPGHLYMHGGAFWLGTLDMFDAECAHLAKLANCVVVSVDYRLAPESKAPNQLEDCVKAWVWLQERSFLMKVNPDKCTIGGSSAGGNLAATTCIALRDRRLPMPKAQVLDIPGTDLTMSQPSIKENGTGYILTEEIIRTAVGYYLADPSQATDPMISPLHAPDLSTLPPALVLTCEFDPLRDEGEAYAKRLQEAGVPTESHRWEGFVHGAGAFTALLPEARDYRASIVEFLNTHHG